MSLSAGAMTLHGPSGVGKSSVLGAAFPKALERIVPDVLIVPFRRWDAGFYNLLLQEAELRWATALADYGSPAQGRGRCGQRRRRAFHQAERNRSGATRCGTTYAQVFRLGSYLPPCQPGPFCYGADAREAPPLTLEQVAERWERQVGTPSIFVFDQFEQYFTGQDFGSTTEDEQFEADLARIIKRRDVGCHVLISIREDALFELNRLRARIPNILARSLKLDYLDRAAAEEAIAGPLEVWRREIGEDAGPMRGSPDLIDALIYQVSRPATSLYRDPLFATGAQTAVARGATTRLPRTALHDAERSSRRRGHRRKPFQRHHEEAAGGRAAAVRRDL